MAIIDTPSINNRSELLRSERIAGGILPKTLTSFDLIVICIAIILWIPDSAIVTGAGAAAYIYWGLGFITFLIPGAIITGQLGLMFPGEGSLYVWTSRALGNFMGFLAGFCAWWPGIITMIAAGDAVVSLIQQFGNLFSISLLNAPGAQGFVIIAVLVLSFVLSMFRFRIVQNLMNIISVIYSGAILLVGLAGVVWLITGHQAHMDLSHHSKSWVLSSSNFTFYGTVVLALLGVEVPLNMGVEIRDVRSIKRYLLGGSIVIIVAYLVATFGVMTVVPLKDQGNPAGIIEAIQAGFGAAGIWIAALADLIFIGFFIATATVFNYSYGRLLFVAGLDRRLPAIISKVSANKIPWVAILVQTIIAISFTAIIFVLAPLSLKSSQLATLLYDILLAAVTVIWCISMVILFFDVLVIQRKYTDIFSHKRLVSDWLLYICSICGSMASIAAIYVIFTAPWTSSIEGVLLTTAQWDIWIASIVIISLIVAIFGFYIGRTTMKSDLSDEEIIKEVTG
jgi:glutamate:GABA antiporter